MSRAKKKEYQMALPKEKVLELLEIMNSISDSKMPAKPPIIGCFEAAMCENTLDFLIAVGKEPHTMEELRAIYDATLGGGDAGWEEVWGEVFEMSFLIPASDEVHYIMVPVFPGWIEFSCAGEMNEKRTAILSSFMDFWQILKDSNTPSVRKLMNRRGMKKREKNEPYIATYVTLNEPITSEHRTHTFHSAYELLEQHKDELVIGACICRRHKLLEQEDYECLQKTPMEACIAMGPVGKQMVANGTARPLPWDEAVEVLARLQKQGCVHTAFHYSNKMEDGVFALCNCCKDCCLMYSGYQEGSLSQVFVKAYHVPKVVDLDACTGCNLCGKYCPTDAIWYDREAGELVFNYDNCVGCGQCVTQCRFGVQEMVEDVRNVFVQTKARPDEVSEEQAGE